MSGKWSVADEAVTARLYQLVLWKLELLRKDCKSPFGVLLPFFHDARLGFCVRIARMELENALFAHRDCVECVYRCIWALKFVRM